MQIGVLGGSFDPPHLGHLSLARQILAKTKINEVWFMPCFKHNFNKKMSPVEDRLKMTKMMVGENIKVSEIEIQRKGVSYTIDTLDDLHLMYPHNHFFWIMGSDQIEFFPRYKAWQEILARHNLMIFPREKNVVAIAENIKKHAIVLDPKEFKINTVSSTEIRERVRKGKSIAGPVSKDVEKYIVKNKLYS